MKTLRLDPVTGDLDLSGSTLHWATGAEYVRQTIDTRLKMFLGEWFLDTRQGFPWFEEILDKKPVPGKLDALVRRTLLGTPEVADLLLLTVEFDRDTRTSKVVYRVKTGDAEIVEGGGVFILPSG